MTSARTRALLDQYGRIIKSRTYFPLWLGQLVSNFGDTLNYVALVILVFRLTGSGLAVSITVVLEIVPVLLLAPVAGVVIDRFPRKAILIGSDLVRAGLVLVLAFANSKLAGVRDSGSVHLSERLLQPNGARDHPGAR